MPIIMTNNYRESSDSPMLMPDLPRPIQFKRKKNCFFPKLFPFPIFRDGPNDTKQPWNCVVGHIKEQCVEITDEQDIRLLFTQGFFGKGTLSRSTPRSLAKSLKAERKKNRKGNKPNGLSNDKQDSLADKQVVDSTDDNVKVENPAKRRKKDEIEVVLSDSGSNNSHDETNENPTDSVSVTTTIAVTTTVADIKETLQLSLEEAFFLSYGLGVLVVKDKHQHLDLMREWHKFCEIHPNQNFPMMYTAYHHLRSKGWVVRSGLKYGADYVLYKDGPPFYHSSYVVIVQPVKEKHMEDITSVGRPPLTWSSLSAISRMCSHVNKTLMILYVIKPTSMSDNKITTPFCVSQFLIEEFVVDRWVPSSCRRNI